MKGIIEKDTYNFPCDLTVGEFLLLKDVPSPYNEPHSLVQVKSVDADNDSATLINLITPTNVDILGICKVFDGGSIKK